jgi:hypothetical protein
MTGFWWSVAGALLVGVIWFAVWKFTTYDFFFFPDDDDEGDDACT